MDVNYKNQSGISVPLTDIVESGDNYIKFNNGVMICWSTYTRTVINPSSSIASTYANALTGKIDGVNGLSMYPVPFISDPAAFISSTKQKFHIRYNSTNGELIWVNFNCILGNQSNANQIGILEVPEKIVTDLSSIYDITYHYSYFAIGRWK